MLDDWVANQPDYPLYSPQRPKFLTGENERSQFWIETSVFSACKPTTLAAGILRIICYCSNPQLQLGENAFIFAW